MDNHSKEVRSYNMSKIRSTGTKPEEIVRKYLFSKELRYRKNVKTLPGKPDIVFPKYKTVVFVNGCFWHGHQNCRYFVMPKSNTEYWENKINNNIARDKITYESLSKHGWNVLIVWECELKKVKCENTLESLYHNILRNSKGQLKNKLVN
ncbi:MAG: DNA mismatch endonuclease Vsr [Ruminococcus sp.]|nr:very short patch repair endonuclease [Ruminococcus sp.]MBS1397218.1 DNA mismatch endonuclease Vsr [Ruminococcus sp.]